jgi:uncharacterized membrane protein YeaQ/YmgE (transglycosylase-associated protein family)
MSIIAFVLLGLIAGFIARAIMPGRQEMGLIATALLGMVGSLIGGCLGSLISGDRVFDLHAAGLIGSVIGSLIVLMLTGARRRRRALG